MYSGSDSTESQNYTQWALNPTAYQNVSSENVDWAALAQQWIIMKEAGPPVLEQTAPPPPNIGNKLKKESLNEGGEAPMDVENEKDEESSVDIQWNEGNAVPPTGDSWNWSQQPPWNWSGTWTPSGVPPPNTVKPPLLPTPPTYNQYAAPIEVTNDAGNYGGYNSVPQNDYSSGYWTAAGSSKIKPHNKRYSKVNVPRAPVVTEPITLDAAKRKQLPAWIREGLEKMERDKQKQLEKERERKDKENFSEKVKLSEKDALEIIKNTVKEQQRGKFESEDESDDEKVEEKSVPAPIPLTQEELMLKVRRTMTEILLNVTNREINLVCKEELQRYIKKIKASDQRVSAPSGTNLSAKLGLGIYGDSASSSEDSEKESQQEYHDSDSELKDIIRKKKVDFSKTEREIEDRLTEADRHNAENSRAGTPEVTVNDTQVDAKLQGRKSRFNNSHEHTPPLKHQQHTAKRKTYRSSLSTSDSESECDKKKLRNYKSKRRRQSFSSESSGGKHKSWRSRSSSLDYKKPKHKDEVDGSKSSSSQSRRSRSKSLRRKRSRSRTKSPKRRRYSKRSRSRSYSQKSRSRSRRSRSRSQYKSFKYRKSRSRSDSYSRSRRRSRSRHRSSSSSRRSHKKRRSPSSSSARGKRSHRH